LIITLIPAYKLSKTQIMPSGNATWQVSKNIALSGYDQAAELIHLTAKFQA
jgi:hypothetical protein